MQILGELAPEMGSLTTSYSEPLSLGRLPELKHVAIMNGPATQYGYTSILKQYFELVECSLSEIH